MYLGIKAFVSPKRGRHCPVKLTEIHCQCDESNETSKRAETKRFRSADLIARSAVARLRWRQISMSCKNLYVGCRRKPTNCQTVDWVTRTAWFRLTSSPFLSETLWHKPRQRNNMLRGYGTEQRLLAQLASTGGHILESPISWQRQFT